MKKIFFSILAIAALSTTVVLAGGKPDAKKDKANTTCQKECSGMTDCAQDAHCQQLAGCNCSK